MRGSALPSVWPKPRSSGSATTVANRVASVPADTCSLFGRISSCQFFWIVTLSPICQSFGPVELPATDVGDRGSVRAWKFQKQSRAATPPATQTSNPPALARTAAIVRDRRHVTDRCDGETRCLQRAKRRFAARTGARNFHFQRAHAVFL